MNKDCLADGRFLFCFLVVSYHQVAQTVEQAQKGYEICSRHHMILPTKAWADWIFQFGNFFKLWPVRDHSLREASGQFLEGKEK